LVRLDWIGLAWVGLRGEQTDRYKHIQIGRQTDKKEKVYGKINRWIYIYIYIYRQKFAQTNRGHVERQTDRKKDFRDRKRETITHT